MRGTLRSLPDELRFHRWWVGLVAFLCALLLASCGAAAEASSADAAAPQAPSYVGAEMPGPMPAPGAPAEGEADMAGGNALGAQPPPSPADAREEAALGPSGAGEPVLAAGEKPTPLLIYRATLTMAVFETRKVMDAIEALAKTSGGYLVTRDDMTITIRVPAGKFDAALDDISEKGDELHRQVEVSDVTEQYNDLSIELKNAEVVRERLVALLERAQKVEEALAVEAELARLTDKIERIKGRLKLLKELVAFSTVTVRFEARPVERVDSKVQLPFPWLKQLGLGELLSL
ncbi:MAG TPA: DUF4349 domain-containing protein [Polyangiaceae bacterium]